MNTNGFLNRQNVALAVGVYDTAVGLWPLVSMKSFRQVTSLEKHGKVVRALGGAWLTLGIALLLSRKRSRLIKPLGIASTVAGGGLALTELLFVSRGRISRKFLYQAAAETAIGAVWVLSLLRGDD